MLDKSATPAMLIKKLGGINMKKTLSWLIFIALLLGIFSLGLEQAQAQSKIIRKTVKKTIQPPIAPEPAPQKVSTQEINSEVPPPPPPPTQDVVTPKTEKGLFGWGRNVDLGALYLINRSGQSGLLGVLAARGDLVFSDPLLLGEKIGLAEDAVEYKLGLGLAFGNDVNNNPINSIPLYADTLIYLKEGAFFGMDPYLGFGLNYNLYGTDQKSGDWGGQIYTGVLVDFGSDLGKTKIAVSYNSIKVSNIRLAEGISISITQPFVL